ncbi:Hypothetical predicted protein [Mytilus galloprovincialis]|uniref:Uncharacterized protein n=1 Tax=Mytilus galloprovincialis TaxID=29158 RepID=A0A8B6CZ67_MYTGA|nr:Hypothetical predicted protein [Mytilus galloprovincialis]
MLVCLLFFMFEISAGITEFPCKFPCEWRNKTFNIYEAGQPSHTWKFSSDVSRKFPDQTEFTDLCGVCHMTDENGEIATVSEAVESGTPATSPPVNSVPCNLPSTCTSSPLGIFLVIQVILFHEETAKIQRLKARIRQPNKQPP